MLCSLLCCWHWYWEIYNEDYWWHSNRQQECAFSTNLQSLQHQWACNFMGEEDWTDPSSSNCHRKWPTSCRCRSNSSNYLFRTHATLFNITSTLFYFVGPFSFIIYIFSDHIVINHFNFFKYFITNANFV